MPSSALIPARRAPVGWVIAAFAAVYLIWGSTYLGITLAVQTIPPFLMAGTRFILAGGGLYLVMRGLGVAAPSRAEWRCAAVVGGLLIFAGNGGVCWAQGRVPSGVSALIVASVPLWMMLLDWMAPGGRRPPAMVIAGLITGGAGVVLIVLSRGSFGGKAPDPVGVGVLLLAAFCWALGSIWSRHGAKPASALLTVAMQMLAGGVLQLMGSAVLGEMRDFDPARVSAVSWWAFVYLTLMGSLVGYTAYVWLLRVSSPARVSTYAYVNPFVAVLLGHFVLKESLPVPVAFAGGLILVSVVLITRPPPSSSNQ